MEMVSGLYSLLHAEGQPYPTVDYRDENEVWLWVAEMELIRMYRSDVKELLKGFSQESDDAEWEAMYKDAHAYEHAEEIDGVQRETVSLGEQMRESMNEWADEVVAQGENGVLGERDLSVQIVRTLADNPNALVNVIDALLYVATSDSVLEDHDRLMAVYRMARSLVERQEGAYA